MATITLSIQTEAGTFSVSASPDDSVIQEMVDAVRVKFNVSASTPEQVLAMMANAWMTEVNQMVTAQRVANVTPLNLVLA